MGGVVWGGGGSVGWGGSVRWNHTLSSLHVMFGAACAGLGLGTAVTSYSGCQRLNAKCCAVHMAVAAHNRTEPIVQGRDSPSHLRPRRSKALSMELSLLQTIPLLLHCPLVCGVQCCVSPLLLFTGTVDGG